MKLFHAAILTVMLISASKASHACDCGILNGMLSGLGDRVVVGITPPLEAVIRHSAAYEATHLRQDLTALRETVMLLKDSVVSAIEASDKNSAERSAERTYEPGSQPETICGGDYVGASLQAGYRTREKAAGDILQRAMQRPQRHQRPLDFLTEIGSEAWPGAEGAARLGLSGGGARTYSLEETLEAERLLESLSNPMPPPDLPDNRKGTPAGRSYTAMKKDYELRLSIYQGVLSRNIASRAPALEGLEGWVRSKWSSMGGAGDPPGLQNGLISDETLFWYLTSMRLSSANWHEEALPALPEAGLLRELAAMEAVNLELQRRQNELLRDLVTLVAISGLEGLSNDKRAALMNQYSQAEQSLGQAGR
jgi:hypothetical protein